ncbi:Serine/threonine-protein kinase [Ceratobasidium sp. AG-Ba]|nr:Serine/threonine-protein kinase [Ceratobasidium sp. AG-Ba]
MSASSLRERKNASGKPRPTSFAGIAKEVDPKNNDLILHRRNRLIPLTKSPFFDKSTIEYRNLREQRRQTSGTSGPHGPGTPGPDYSQTYAGMLTADEIKDVDKSNDEERGERPPAWLDLFFDLAWASTFSNLTQNNTISGGKETISYGVFFSMVWWMWVSQVSYDIRFYSNDWFHRIFVFLQLCVFGALSAFTNKFDVTAFVGPKNDDPFEALLFKLTGMSPAQQAAQETADDRYPQNAFIGIAFIIGVSRLLLFIQYIRVWLYAHDKRDPAVAVKPLALITSAGLWFGSFGMLLSAKYSNNAAQISKFIMWGVATLIEIAGHAFAPPAGHLRSMGSLSARLATLVTIILGEGLNAITGTLKLAVQSLGFNARSGGLVIATGVVVYLTFYLYFEGTRPRISKNRRSLWICLHLPYLLCVILLMEGLKNLLLYSMLYNSYTYVITTFSNNLNLVANITDADIMIQTLNQTMTPFLAKIGFSWELGWGTVVAEMSANGTYDQRLEQYYIGMYRLLMNITDKVFSQFDEGDRSPEAQVAIFNYLHNDTLTALDIPTQNLPFFMNVVSTLAQPQVQGARWITALAGGVLIFLACINVAQEWPKDRYAWGSVISRFINGLILVFLLLMNINSGEYLMESDGDVANVWKWLDSYWALPTLAFSLLLQAIIDHILLVLSVYSADRELERTYEPSLLDPLRDHKDGAYDPPTVSYPYSSTPASADFTTSPTQHQQHNWQPAYVPQTQPQYVTPPITQHQTSYGFVAPPPPPPFMGSGGSAIPPGGIVTPSR